MQRPNKNETPGKVKAYPGYRSAFTVVYVSEPGLHSLGGAGCLTHGAGRARLQGVSQLFGHEFENSHVAGHLDNFKHGFRAEFGMRVEWIEFPEKRGIGLLDPCAHGFCRNLSFTSTMSCIFFVRLFSNIGSSSTVEMLRLIPTIEEIFVLRQLNPEKKRSYLPIAAAAGRAMA
jgi:hypothetical protein